MAPCNQKIHTGIIYFLIYITAVLYFFLFYDYGINLWDEGIAANGALRVLNGETVSRDFLGYAPGRYYLFALSFYISGINLLTIRKLIVLITASMPLLGYLISREIMNRYFAILPFFLILSAPSVYYNRFFPFFTLLNLLLIMKYLKYMDRKFLVCIISAIAVTLLFKIEIGIISLLCLLIASIVKKRFINREKLPFTKISIVTAIPIIILLSILYITIPQGLLPILRYRLYHIFVLHNEWGNPFPELFTSEIFTYMGIFQLIERLLFYLPIPVYILSVLLSIKNIREKTQDHHLNIIIISIFGLCVFGLVIWRAGFDNLIRVLPVFYILGCYFLSICYHSLSDTKLHRVNGIFCVLIPLILIFNFTFNHGFYVGSIGVLRGEKILLNIERARVFAKPVEAGWIEEIVSYVINNTNKDDYIFTVPLNPIWYFLTDRKNPTFYEWILPGSLQDSRREQEEIVNVLREKMPRAILLGDIAIDGKEERRFSNYADYIHSYIAKTYNLARMVGFFQIMELDDKKR